MIETKKIYKSFFGKPVLKGIDFTLLPGEVHCIVGENGAGKSTFVKILSGVYSDYQGTITINGNEIRLDNPRISRSQSIATIQQSRDLVPTLNAVDNIFLGIEKETTLGILKREDMINEAEKIIKRFGRSLDLNTFVKNLEVDDQEVIAISKAILMNFKYLLMDEATAPLGRNDRNTLFKQVNELKQKGIGVLYITHNLKEIYDIGDRVTVLRDGENVYTGEIPDIKKLIKLMIGKSSIKAQEKEIEKTAFDKPVLEINDLSIQEYLTDINFKVHAGEILGIYGLEGESLHMLGEVIFGLYKNVKGNIYLNGKQVKGEISHRIKHGIGYIPNNRSVKGLMLARSVGENISLVRIGLSSKLNILKKNLHDIAKEGISQLRIITQSDLQEVKYLSGGNQQKVLLAKWLTIQCPVLILDEPTEGVDVGVRFEVYSLLKKKSKEGAAIVIISTDLDQLMYLCHKIIVLTQGRIKKSYDLTKSVIGKDIIIEQALATN